MRLAVIDASRPEWVPELVPHLDALGYARYWATEQHGPKKSASPTLMAAMASALSVRMRVGTAGVLLNFYSPVKVVEDFNLLQLLSAGRADLGVTGTSVAEPLATALLDGRPPPRAETYSERVRRLVRLVRCEAGADGEISGAALGPKCPSMPELWICGSSERSALLAAELGVCYAFQDSAAFTGPASQRGGAASTQGPSGRDIVATYRREFRAHPSAPAPRLGLVCWGICAETSELAASLWERTGQSSPAQVGDPRPGFCGSPEECRRQLQELQERYQPDEIVVQSTTTNFEAYMRSYFLLAKVCGLE